MFLRTCKLYKDGQSMNVYDVDVDPLIADGWSTEPPAAEPAKPTEPSAVEQHKNKK